MKINRRTEHPQRYSVFARLTKGEYQVLALKAAMYFGGKNRVSQLLRDAVKAYNPEIPTPSCYQCGERMENTTITKRLYNGVTVTDFPAWTCTCGNCTTNLHLGAEVEKQVLNMKPDTVISFNDLLKL
ncbi:hypothetical protein DNHGIG_40530 [Collibacillus ludicampi]|uniref:YgiT-type zinc finger protein n=1 Tax=Collibacillus ludicampi TaxID=2771369 RepID=A0AAV4LN15_9BACL|nr:hypothetical protein [Collibacillus ludicampi]GIM48504.1 hypothetical protein DNHGIG_40530 [Collibacillus ludicampi]